MRKKSLAVLLALAMLLGLFPATALADEPGTDAPPQAVETVEAEAIAVDTSDTDLPDSDELFAGYVQQLLYPQYSVSLFGNFGESTLPEDSIEQKIYTGLKERITQVANGQLESASFTLTWAELGITKTTWTAADLGGTAIMSGSSINPAAASAVKEQIGYDQSAMSGILDRLLVDCPYELYWYDKSYVAYAEGNPNQLIDAAFTYPGSLPLGASYDPNGTNPENDSLYLTGTGLTFTFKVSEDYSADGTQGTTDVNTAKTSAAADAVESANQIIADNKDKSDYEKLLAYKDAICARVSYNSSAADENTNTPYGDPWQIIYVFDNNESTNVVCEGYAKAFQYLCDLSTFTGDVACYTVTGTTNAGKGAGDHMWNIVTLDGTNYLVDVTNSDEGAIGQDGGLFLAGTSGSVDSGYTFQIDENNSITYTYDTSTKNLNSGTSILTLANSSYVYTPPATLTGITVGSADGQSGDVAVPVKGQETTVQLKATANYSDSTQDEVVTNTATWSLKDGPVTGVEVSDQGLVTIQPTAAGGSVTVQASYGGETGEITITLTKEDEDVIAELGEIQGPDTADIPASGQTNIYTYTVAAYNKYGEQITSGLRDDVNWILKVAGSGGTDITSTGFADGVFQAEFKVSSDAAAESITIQVSPWSDTGPEMTKTVTLQKEESRPTSFTVNTPDPIAVPTVEGIGQTAEATVQMTVTVRDQYGQPMEGQQIELEWNIGTGSVPGISVDPDTGLVTVTNQAEDGEYSIGAVCGAMGDMTSAATLTVTKEPLAAAFVQITKNGDPITADTITIPTGSEPVIVTYGAEVYDQYGAEFSSDATTWSIPEGYDLPTGVTRTNGTITVASDAEADTFILEADNNGHTARIQITVSEKPAPGLSWDNSGNITVTYGETATGHTAEAISTGKIAYTSNSAAVEVDPDTGALTIKGATATPATITATIAATDDYAGAFITYQVTVDKKELEITGLTAVDRDYKAGDTSVTLTGGALSGKVGTDDVTCDIPQIGSIANADAGTGKQVTVTAPSLTGTSAGNYTLKEITGITVDIAKAKPAVGTVSKTSPDTIFTSTSSDEVVLTCDGTVPAGTLTLDSTTFTVGTKAYGWTFTPTDQNNYEVVTGTIKLEVTADTLKSIAITKNPTKTAYTVGEIFDPTGMEVKATFASGAEIASVPLDQLRYSEDPLAVGTDRITISYTNNGVTQTANVAITVSKADATEDMMSAAGTIMAGQPGSVPLPALPDGASYGNPSTSSTSQVTGLSISGGTLIYTGGEGVVTGTEYTVTIPVAESTNYNTYTITVTLTGTDKTTPAGSPTLSVTTLTYGQALRDITLSGSMIADGAPVAGAFAWDAPSTKPNAGSYTAAWTFTPSDTSRYTTVTGTVTITVNKATPTGAPKYTSISSSGKTLADAGLTTVGGTFSVSGTVTWELPGTTEVKANTDYKWIFTPSDGSNYYSISGTIELWHRSSSGSSGGSSSGSTTTDRNPDGSTTTTTTGSNGTVTETTRWPDGSKEVVETKTDGTVTTTTTDKAGNETEVVEKPNGSTETTISNTDGSSSTTSVSRSGQVESSVKLPLQVIEDAADKGEAVTLPMPEVPVTSNRSDAPTITVDLPAGRSARVEIPVENVTAGTVAILVKADGTEQVIRTSVTTENGVAVSLSDGDTVKILDNAKSFSDVSDSYWAADAIDFATSRELFSGSTATTFNPAGTTNRQQVWMVLARLNGSAPADMAAARTWAMDNGISDGSNPTGTLNRQQLAAMLYRYAQSRGQGFTGTWAFQLDYPDASTVSSYAYEAMCWMTMHGIIGGMTDGTLNPYGPATRAQMAVILQRFVEVLNG